LQLGIQILVERIVKLPKKKDAFAFGQQAMFGDFGDPERPFIKKITDSTNSFYETVGHNHN